MSIQNLEPLVRRTKYKEGDLPETVYKYRDWRKLKHKSILTAKQVWFAQPSKFDDPLDCKIPIRYDLLTEEDIYNKYLISSKEEHPLWTRIQHRKFARHWTKISPLKNKKRLKEFEIETFHEFDVRFGVLSLTANPRSSAMWKEYSANHTGFCVGFNPKITFSFFGGGGIVRYLDELPIIMPIPIHDLETQHYLQVFSKLKKWEYEEEYRVHKFDENPLKDEQRRITLPTNAFKEIIFGATINKLDKQEIIEITKSYFPNVLLKQAQITDNGEIMIISE